MSSEDAGAVLDGYGDGRAHVLPGGGWMVTHLSDSAGKDEFSTEPVIGWIVDERGDGVPLCRFEMSGVGPIESNYAPRNGRAYRTAIHSYSFVWHPDESPPIDSRRAAECLRNYRDEYGRDR